MPDSAHACADNNRAIKQSAAIQRSALPARFSTHELERIAWAGLLESLLVVGRIRGNTEVIAPLFLVARLILRL